MTTTAGGNADGLAMVFALLGGFFMGAYPVPIKAPSVRKVDPHPVIFQCYKTFWVFLSGWIFVVARLVQQEEIAFEFTWWGLVSAAGWIPSGLSTIAAVPRLGLALAIAVSTGTASVLSFLVFWLVLREDLKEHTIAGHRVYFAPFYMIAIVIGMVLLTTFQQRSPFALHMRLDDGEPSDRARRARTFLSGLAYAGLAGLFSAIQYGCVTGGKVAQESSVGCRRDSDKCPDALKEQFNNFGSWNASFGVGALLVTSAYVGLLIARDRVRKEPLPDAHFETLKIPGSIAGICWVLGNLFQTAAVVRGGNSVMVPANQGIQLVTSGAFGLFYYWEVPDRKQMFSWICAALWTLGFIILLSREKP